MLSRRGGFLERGGFVDAERVFTSEASFTGPETAGFPVADYTYVFTSGSLEVVFTDASSGGIAYAWTFGDGGTSTAASPSRTYAASGSYAVTQTVLDTGGDYDSDTQVVRVRGVATPSMLTAVAGSTTDATSFSTASISPVADQPVYLAVLSLQTGGPPTPTVTGNGLTWVVVRDTAVGANRRMTVWRTSGATPSAGAVLIDWGVGNTQSSAVWALVQFAAADASGSATATVQAPAPVVALASTSVAHPTLAAFGNPNNVNLTFVGSSINAASAIVPDAAFTELGDAGVSTATNRINVSWARNVTTGTATGDAGDLVAFSLEVAGS